MCHKVIWIDSDHPPLSSETLGYCQTLLVLWPEMRLSSTSLLCPRACLPATCIARRTRALTAISALYTVLGVVPPEMNVLDGSRLKLQIENQLTGFCRHSPPIQVFSATNVFSRIAWFMIPFSNQFEQVFQFVEFLEDLSVPSLDWLGTPLVDSIV